MLLGGCATGREKLDAYRANGPRLDPQSVKLYVGDQIDIYDRLNAIDPVPRSAGDYRPIVNAGMMYVDIRCARYMDALFWFNRVSKSANRQLGYLGSASAAILEIVDASSALVALAPIAFKFATETVDGVGKGLLYDMSPGAVRSIVDEQQVAFKKAIEGQRYTSKTAALQVVQAYLMLCLPVSIEGQVEQAVKNAKFREKPDDTSEQVTGTKTVTVETVTKSVDGKTLAPPATTKTTTETLVPAPKTPEVDTNKVPVLTMMQRD